MKQKFLHHFQPWGISNADRIESQLTRDPKLILERILEDCEKPDIRENAVSPEALKSFKPSIEKALKLYEAGEYKKLAWVMFDLGMQAEFLNYWPLLKEGKTRVNSYHRGGEKSSKKAAQDDTTIKSRILKAAPNLLKAHTKLEVVNKLSEQFGCSKKHVRNTIKIIPKK